MSNLNEEERAKRFPVQVFSRVNGWYTSVYKSWNKGKISEWKDRVTYKVNEKEYVE